MNWAPSGSRSTASSGLSDSTLPPFCSAARAQRGASATAKCTCQCGRIVGSGAASRAPDSIRATTSPPLRSTTSPPS